MLKDKVSLKERLKENIRSLRWDRNEIAGSLGDLGTFIPIFVGLVAVCGLNPGSMLFFAGLFNILSGFIFGIPIAVQPMKAIGTIGISEALSPNQIYAAGIITSLVIFFLGLTNLVSFLKKAIPFSVVRGIQLGLGLKLLISGINMVVDTAKFFGYDSILVGFICAGLVLIFFFSRRVPGALLIFVLGLILVLLEKPKIINSLSLGFSLPSLILPTKNDFLTATFLAAIPQIPLTALNSIIAVCALSWDLFPNKGVSERGLATSVGIMNLIGCWFGAMPMCHGAGGLAGQYHFGARTGGSVVFLGTVKMILGLFFALATFSLLKGYPQSVLGILFVFAGFELALVSRDMQSKTDFFVMLITAASSLALKSIALGFVLGFIFAYLFIFGVLRFEKID